MKMIINEKQFAHILGKSQEIDEVDATTSTITTVPMADVSSGPKTPSVVPSSSGGSSGGGGGASTKTDDIGSSPGAADMPAYPEVDRAEDKVKRGPANQVATKSNWSDVVGSTLTRGPANPLKGM